MSRKDFHKASPTGVQPSDIAKEALWLYALSWRVHRDFDGMLHRAETKACHRSKVIGGEDLFVFRPERWRKICSEKWA
jgi:hypothetical protein